jgi:hypothetical protein
MRRRSILLMLFVGLAMARTAADRGLPSLEASAPQAAAAAAPVKMASTPPDILCLRHCGAVHAACVRQCTDAACVRDCADAFLACTDGCDAF